MTGNHEKWKGKSMRSKEAPRFLTGRARYIADIFLPGMLFCSILRSPYAHAEITSIDVSKATSASGVRAVITGEDTLNWASGIGRTKLQHELPLPASALAQRKVRFQGQPIVAIAARSKEEAEDALDLLHVEYRPLPPVMTLEQAKNARFPTVFDETPNFTLQTTLVYGDPDSAFAQARTIVRDTFRLHRYSSTALDTKGCIASYDHSTGHLTLHMNVGHPSSMWRKLAMQMGLAPNKLRLVVPDIGGQFGNKSGVMFPEYAAITTLLSIKTGSPVKYVETRTESLMGEGQSGETILDLEAAVNENGIVEALHIHDYENGGASLEHIQFGGTYQALNKLGGATGAYRIRHVSLDGGTIVTNQCPSFHNRAIGLPGMLFTLERLMDRIAHQLNLDPVEIRMRNYIRPDEFPYVTPTGNVYDSANFSETSRKALEIADYEAMRKLQSKGRENSRFLGIGISASVEPSAANPARHHVASEDFQKPVGVYSSVVIKMDITGRVTLHLPTPFAGQGHETTAAQIVADELDMVPDDIEVYASFDSLLSPTSSIGTGGGNTFAVYHIGAVVKASRSLRDKILKIASAILGVSEKELKLSNGKVVKGTDSNVSVTLRDIARIAYEDLLLLPEGIDPGLHIISYYRYPHSAAADSNRRVKSHVTFPNAAHIAIVEVDPETGKIELVRYVVVADHGVLLNPAIVEGQTIGNALHGISAALGEGFIYDEQGQLLTNTFMDYLKPTSMDTINFQIAHTSHPSEFSETGAKGAGEGAAALAPAAIVAAVEDALAPFNVKLSELGLTAERLWKAQRGR